MITNQISFIRKDNKDRSENNRVTNVLKLLFMLLKNDNQSIEYYARELNCKTPTIKKYLKDIRSSFNSYDNTGFDVIFNSREKHYELFSHMKFPAFTPEAIEALHMAVRYLIKHEGTPFEHLEEIEKKLQRYFTKEIREKLNKDVEFTGPEIKSRLQDVLNIIDEAINQKLKLIITYMPTFQKESITREIVPFLLQIYDYEWYIKGYCLESHMMKTFAINHISDMRCDKLTKGEAKSLPEKIDLSSSHRWDWTYKDEHPEPQIVRIKFIGPMAVKMKKKTLFRKEHPSQEIEVSGEDKKEETIVSFKVRNPYNMIQWILQFGSQARVIEPENLKSKIKKELDAIRLLYDEPV